MNGFFRKKILLSSLSLPLFFYLAPLASAQVPNTTLRGVGDFKGFVEVAINIFSQFVVFLIGLAVFIIVWGIFKYIRKVDDPKERTNGMRFVAWGILGVFIMISFWGLVNIIGRTFILPGVNFGGGGGGQPSNGDTRSNFVESCVASGRGRYLCELDYEKANPDSVPVDYNTDVLPPEILCPNSHAPSTSSSDGCYE